MLQKPFNILLILTCMTLAALGVLSCDNGCEQMRESYMHVQFTSTSSRTLRSLNIDAHGRRKGMELSDSTTLQYTFNATKFENVELELNPNDSIVNFVLRTDYTDYGDKFQVNDTVRILYSTNGRFLDMECGCTVDYEILKVSCTHNLLIDVKVEEPQIHTESGINLEFTY